MTISRYQSVPIATLVTAAGEHIPYLRRRFLPVMDPSAPVRVHQVRAAEQNRPDLIAAAELGDAELAWLLADTNPVDRPSELCQHIGQTVRVPSPAGLNIGAAHAQ